MGEVGVNFEPHPQVLVSRDRPERKGMIEVGSEGTIIYSDRFGEKRPLEHAVAFPPDREGFSELPEFQQRVFKEVFGVDALDELAGKTVVIPYIFAGWGHTFQAVALGKELSRFGIRAIVVDTLELLTPDEAHGLAMKQAFYKDLHHKADGSLVKALVRKKNGVKSFIKDTALAGIYTVANMHVRSLDAGRQKKINGHDFIPQPLDHVNRFLENRKELHKSVMRTSIAIESTLTDLVQKDALVHFLDASDASFVASTHPSPARALVGTTYEERLLNAIPDPGYGADASILQPLVILSDRLINLTADENVAKMLHTYYGLPRDHIYPVGTISDRMSRKEIEDKWTVPERRILLSTSGNGNHMTYLARAVFEFAPELQKPDTKYRVSLFLGNQPDEVVAPVLEAIDKSGLAGNQYLRIIRTHNPIDTSLAKWREKKWAQVEVVKPGENPLDDPLIGTVCVGLPPGSLNETENMRVSAEWGSAIPSAWPPDVFDRWIHEGIGYRGAGFTRAQDNLVSYLDSLYSDSNGPSILKEKMNRGLIAPPQGGSFLTAGMVASGVLERSRYGEAFGGKIAKRDFERLLHQYQKEKGLERVMNIVESDWAVARDNKDILERTLLELAGYPSMEAFLSAVKYKTAVVTFLAGAGTRWVASWDDPKNKSLVTTYGISRDLPRALTHVPNFIPGVVGDTIPIGMYNVNAVKHIGMNIIVHNGHEEAIDREIVKPLGAEAVYRRQIPDAVTDKPLGHGDAMMQVLDYFKNREYVVTNFGSDPNNPKSIELSLLLMYVMDRYRKNIAAVIPSAAMPSPKYPILLGTNGIPMGISQEKLRPGDGGHKEPGVSNVGVRVYRTKDLINVLREFKDHYEQSGSYAGVNNGNNELALDNIDERLMRDGRVRQLAIADPKEILHPAKSIDAIPAFIDDMRDVLGKNSRF